MCVLDDGKSLIIVECMLETMDHFCCNKEFSSDLLWPKSLHLSECFFFLLCRDFAEFFKRGSKCCI